MIEEEDDFEIDTRITKVTWAIGTRVDGQIHYLWNRGGQPTWSEHPFLADTWDYGDKVMETVINQIYAGTRWSLRNGEWLTPRPHRVTQPIFPLKFTCLIEGAPEP